MAGISKLAHPTDPERLSTSNVHPFTLRAFVVPHCLFKFHELRFAARKYAVIVIPCSLVFPFSRPPYDKEFGVCTVATYERHPSGFFYVTWGLTGSDLPCVSNCDIKWRETGRLRLKTMKMDTGA
jgi:hypothetical protein